MHIKINSKSKTIKSGPKNITKINKKTTIASRQAKTNIINNIKSKNFQNILNKIFKRKTI